MKSKDELIKQLVECGKELDKVKIDPRYVYIEGSGWLNVSTLKSSGYKIVKWNGTDCTSLI